MLKCQIVTINIFFIIRRFDTNTPALNVDR